MRHLLTLNVITLINDSAIEKVIAYHIYISLKEIFVWNYFKVIGQLHIAFNYCYKIFIRHRFIWPISCQYKSCVYLH